MEIVEAKRSDLASFFDYIATQLVENADDESPLFQPMSKDSCQVTEQFEAKFYTGFDIGVGELGWRKLWVVKDSNQRVVAHIDLRHYNQEYKYHRVLLGMGVDSSLRKQGIGEKLIQAVIQFCRQQSTIDWLDLNVLTNNVAAKNLYLKCGFSVIGEMSDCYRIDGQSVSELSMTLGTKTRI